MHRDESDAGAPRRQQHGLGSVGEVLFSAWGALAAALLLFLVNTIAGECGGPADPAGRCANGLFFAIGAFVVISVPWIVVMLVLSLFDP